MSKLATKILESRQKVSNQNSRVYFFPYVSVDDRENFCNILGFHSTPSLRKYLGIPLKQPGTTTQDFDFVIEKVKGKLAGWKAQLLSFVGRVVLTQSVLSSIPSYVMQNNFLLSRVLESLDRISRNFIWGAT